MAAIPDAVFREMVTFGILDPTEQALYLAQISHESGGFEYLEEIASGAAYEGRADLGNTQPGDGVRYKGRGYIQLTGRNNYQNYGDLIGIDLVNNPYIASEPEVAARLAAAYWKTRVQSIGAQTSLDASTLAINGGYNGYADRQARFNAFLGTQAETTAAILRVAPDADQVLSVAGSTPPPVNTGGTATDPQVTGGTPGTPIFTGSGPGGVGTSNISTNQNLGPQATGTGAAIADVVSGIYNGTPTTVGSNGQAQAGGVNPDIVPELGGIDLNQYRQDLYNYTNSQKQSIDQNYLNANTQVAIQNNERGVLYSTSTQNQQAANLAATIPELASVDSAYNQGIIELPNQVRETLDQIKELGDATSLLQDQTEFINSQ